MECYHLEIDREIEQEGQDSSKKSNQNVYQKIKLEKAQTQCRHAFNKEQTQKQMFQNCKNIFQNAQIKQQKKKILLDTLIKLINYRIYEMADKNEAYRSKYEYFIMLLSCTLLQLQTVLPHSSRIKAVLKYCLKVLQKQQVKKQIQEKHYYQFMVLVTRKEKLTVDSIHQFMRKILKEQREICVSLFPLYFNLFALVVNKSIIFMNQSIQKMINYTFDHQITEYHYPPTPQAIQTYLNTILKKTQNQLTS